MPPDGGVVQEPALPVGGRELGEERVAMQDNQDPVNVTINTINALQSNAVPTWVKSALTAPFGLGSQNPLQGSRACTPVPDGPAELYGVIG